MIRRRLHHNANAFTLIEMLVVVSIIVLLIAMLLPSLGKMRHEARSVKCATNKRLIATGLSRYAQNNHSYYPLRWRQTSSYNHPFWWGKKNATLDMHEIAEEISGGSPGVNLPPAALLCEIAPKAIWGIDIPWPLTNIYRTNVAVTGGWDWRTATGSACVPMLPLDQMPLRSNQAVDRPVAFDLIEHMTGNSGSYSGWVIGHQSNPAYHVRNANGPEASPPDAIPFAFGDGSVRMTNELEPYYLDPGWGIKHWAAD
jgi:prepilin-type N-terminal cleavage/methylation domain-containing protein